MLKQADSLPASPWLPVTPSFSARLRVFCFPYAGGGPIVFKDWQPYFDDKNIQICPIAFPGREKRMKEPALTSMELWAEGAYEAIRPYLSEPFALLGLCFGGSVAFETALMCMDAGSSPDGMLITGNRAPHVPSSDNIDNMDDTEFITHLRHLQFIPEVIFDTKDLLDLFLPPLRVDFSLDASYVFKDPVIPFHFPLSVFWGKNDTSIERNDILAWHKYTNVPLTTKEFEGDQLFFRNSQEEYLKAIKQELRTMSS